MKNETIRTYSSYRILSAGCNRFWLSLLLMAFIGFFDTGSLYAQEGNTGSVTVDSVRLEWKPSIDIRMRINLDALEVSTNGAVEIMPLLVGVKDTLELPSILVNGRTRHIVYMREPKKRFERYKRIVRRQDGKIQHVDYAETVAAQSWMDGAKLVLVTDLCGCGWRSVEAPQQLEVAEVQAPKFEPLLAYIVPQREEVKHRAKSGRAYIDFPVNKAVINPDYRNNKAELRKIQATIDSVRANSFATITEVGIKGFASPEGSYTANERLAEGRADALADYVRRLYQFPSSVNFRVESEAEDWEGLEEFIRDSDLAAREELLAVIQDADIKDLDAREAQLKRVAGAETYRYLLQHIYPALRHSDYTVNYTIRNFTTDEAKKLLYTDPRQLSLEEIYRVAQTYETGSREFCEVFEIAVRLYPDDPLCNLNAANIALLRQDAKAARRYLDKAKPGKEKDRAEKALKQLEEYLENKVFYE